ncbi:ABC transporter substrate-binding protein [Paenibacillus nasutitermitis]|uniref:Sugar ABC transporter substrate-binding protein n=1 Tax=Paenibacillus nasutitermitis TaxID=1652958 RepID=A0A916YL97_9BACL|nr:extracellular solute-binding protein [Paenibacillus nasutitermitis]GGD50077.1 sugar ABC transporter substrate-binding protein [Paenibacillus nasutitermitis]
MRKKTKLVLWGTLALVLMLVTAACGNGGSNNKVNAPDSSTANSSAATSQSGENSEAPKEVKEISLLMFADWYKSGFQAIENDINSRSEELGFKLNVEKIVGGAQGDNLIKARFAANELPDLLAIYGTNWMKNNLNGLGSFQELTGDWTKNYPESIMSTANFSDGGKVYGIPFDNVNILGVFYNKKIFDQLGLQPPQTYQQFLDACEKIKQAGITPIYLPAKDTWTVNAFEHEAWFRMNEPLGSIFEKINTNQARYADYPLYKDAFVKHKELLDKGYIQSTYLSDTYDSAQQAIANGTAAMTINETWIMDAISLKFPDKVDDIGAFRVPFDESKMASLFLPFQMAATNDFEDKELLNRFIAYFTSKETQQKFYDAQGGIPAISGVDSKLAPAQADLKKLLDDNRVSQFWADLALYNSGDQNASVLDYFTGGKSVDDILKAMDEATTKAAKSKNDPNWK